MQLKALHWTAKEIAAAAAPNNFQPITSHSEFGWRNGPFFERKTADSWQRGFRVSTEHANAGGICHGGMLMTFGDIVLATAVIRAADPPCVTVRMESDMMGAARIGVWVEGTAEVTGVDGSMIHVRGLLTADGKPCMGLNGIFKQIARRHFK